MHRSAPVVGTGVAGMLCLCDIEDDESLMHVIIVITSITVWSLYL